MSFTLTIQPIAQTVEVEDDQTLLDACLRAGIWLPHACCHGLCATCKVQVTDGEVAHGDASPFALMEFERDEGKVLACCATLQSDATIEADIDHDPDAKVIPVEDYEGEVIAIEQASPTVKIIRLRLDRPLPFQAGQYINLDIPTLGQRRAFSIANPPSRAGELALHVRHVPGGAGTTYLHQQLAIGDTLHIAGPYGRFFVRHTAHRRDQLPLLFIAGGSGLSSPLSMIEDLFDQGCTLPITLVYGQRNQAELYHHLELSALAAAHPNFTYLPALSDEPEDSGWRGARGHAHAAAKAHFNNDFSGRKAYLCGPPLMIDACLSTLMQGRLYERDIHTEKFLSAADAQRTRSPLFRSV
jgi:phenol/toluene 2-monooxygenase (NADH) P5/A5